MKTIDKTFDAVKYMREQRDGLNKKLSGMTKDEIVKYFRKSKERVVIKPLK